MSEEAIPSLNSRMMKNLANSATDVVEKEAKMFTGMSNQLGVPVAWMFLMVVVFCGGALIYFKWIVMPDHAQAIEDRKADNKTKLTLATAYETLADHAGAHTAKMEAMNEKLGTLVHKAEQANEGERSRWRILSDIRDEFRAWNGKPPIPRTAATAAAAAKEGRTAEEKADRPEAPPMPETDGSQ